MTRSFVLTACCWMLACGAFEARARAGVAQVNADDVRVEMRVTALGAGNYYLDKGSAAGLAVGDRVRVTTSGGGVAEGTIRGVSKLTARLELDPGSLAPEVGDRVEAWIPKARVAPPASAPTPSAPTAPTAKPDHPAWTHPEENWAPNQPLLAPAFGLAPEERPSRWRGRAWMQAQSTWDQQGGTRRYVFGNTGVDATLENPFGQGGTFRIDTSVWTRSADADGIGESSSETKLRVRRLTYEFGGTEDAPTHWQFGRFLPSEFPELGLLDGLDWTRALDGGDRVGALLGAMPRPTSDLRTFDDVQAAVYWRHAFDDARRNTFGAAYQNTWHHGEQDRNLFLVDARLRPTDAVSWRTSAWIDLYGPGDTVKDGAELTEFQTSANWQTTTTTGVGATYAHRVVPELLRDEYTSYTATQLDRYRLDRVSAYGWWSATHELRFDGRVDHWTDQDDSGSTYEIGGALRDTLWDAGDVRASFFVADGSYSSGPGVRVGASRAFGRAFASLTYEFVDYEQKDVVGDLAQLGQHALYGTLDVPVFEGWDLSLTAERRFGDQQDSYGFGVLLQTRF